MTYQLRRAQWAWRDFLTAGEREEVALAELHQANAKRDLAEATARLNPIRNRAIHRAKYAARKERP